MSFPRHREIYRSDGRGRSWALVWSRSWARSWGSAWIWGWARSGAEAAPGAHRFDESPAGYSLAGWSPPEPASASPAQSSMHQNGTERYTFTVNGSLSLIKLSHARGSLHRGCPGFPRFPAPVSRGFPVSASSRFPRPGFRRTTWPGSMKAKAATRRPSRFISAPSPFAKKCSDPSTPTPPQLSRTMPGCSGQRAARSKRRLWKPGPSGQALAGSPADPARESACCCLEVCLSGDC